MTEKSKKVSTLLIVHDHPRILLGMKKRGFGAGRWNGFGGKLMSGETIEDAARREVFEEAQIKVGNLNKLGVLEFEFEGNPELLEVHLFKVNDFSGEPMESEEMSPKWFFTEEIPFSEMWPDDRYWFPFFMRNKKFKARFLFGPGDEIINYEIAEVSDF